MTPENRRRLTKLVAAYTKLVAAASLVQAASTDVEQSGLLLAPRVFKDTCREIDVLTERISRVIELIP